MGTIQKRKDENVNSSFMSFFGRYKNKIKLKSSNMLIYYIKNVFFLMYPRTLKTYL